MSLALTQDDRMTNTARQGTSGPYCRMPVLDFGTRTLLMIDSIFISASPDKTGPLNAGPAFTLRSEAASRLRRHRRDRCPAALSGRTRAVVATDDRLLPRDPPAILR